MGTLKKKKNKSGELEWGGWKGRANESGSDFFPVVVFIIEHDVERFSFGLGRSIKPFLFLWRRCTCKKKKSRVTVSVGCQRRGAGKKKVKYPSSHSFTTL